MPNTFTLIASSTVGSGGQAAIDFTSIPGTYTDLCLRMSVSIGSAGGTAQAMYITINGSTSTFTGRYLYGDALTPATANLARYVGSVNNHFPTCNNMDIYLPNYAGSNNKSFSVYNVTERNSATADANIISGAWGTTSAITSLSVAAAAASFVQYSTAYLYGVKNA
jgi:hypothetical protein